MKKPLISIITANRNCGYDLSKTAESIKKNYCNSIEWIIIDCKSIDTTKLVVQKYKKYIKTFISENDNGIYDAWNKGIKIALGEWIMFLGSGDILEKNAIKNYKEKVSKKTNEVNLITSKVKIVNQNNIVKKVIGEKFEKEKFLNYMTIAHIGTLHHRRLFRYSSFNTKYKISSDYHFLLTKINIIKPVFLNKVTATMLAGGASDTYNSLYERLLIQLNFNHLPKIRLYLIFISSICKKILRKILKGY